MKRLLLIIFILALFSIAGASVYDAVRNTVQNAVSNTVNPRDSVAPITGDWILETGVWNDAGVWKDTSTWNDS